MLLLLMMILMMLMLIMHRSAREQGCRRMTSWRVRRAPRASSSSSSP